MSKQPFGMHLDADAFLPATESEKEYMVQMRPATTFFADGVRRLLKNKVATISFFVIVFLTLTCIFLPIFWPYGYDEMLGMGKYGRMDSSYNNLRPLEYGATELARIADGERVFPHLFGSRPLDSALVDAIWMVKSSFRATPLT